MTKFRMQYNCRRCGERFQQAYSPPAADIATVKQMIDGKFERAQWHICSDAKYGLFEVVGFDYDDSTLTTEDATKTKRPIVGEPISIRMTYHDDPIAEELKQLGKVEVTDEGYTVELGDATARKLIDDLTAQAENEARDD